MLLVNKILIIWVFRRRNINIVQNMINLIYGFPSLRKYILKCIYVWDKICVIIPNIV